MHTLKKCRLPIPLDNSVIAFDIFSKSGEICTFDSLNLFQVALLTALVHWTSFPSSQWSSRFPSPW